MSLKEMCYLSPSPGRDSVRRNTFSEAAERNGASAMRNIYRVFSMRLNIRKEIGGGGGEAKHNDTLASK